MATTTTTPTPSADYLREVRSCAMARRRTIYVWHEAGKFTSGLRLPHGLGKWWVASPSGTVRPYTAG